jgi:hypothetical protein
LVLAGLALLLTARRRAKVAAGRTGAERGAEAGDRPRPTSPADFSTGPADPPASPTRLTGDEGRTSFPWPAPAVHAGTAAEAEETAVQPDEDETAEQPPADRGTDPVPVVGRFRRRSRREGREAPLQPAAGAQKPPVEAPTGLAATDTFTPAPGAVPPPPGAVPPPSGAVSPPPGAFQAPPEPPAMTTGSLPVVDGRPLTRRQLREREQARRAAEPGGMGRRLRALTGSIPVVRQPAQTPPPELPQADAETSAAANRAAAWRQAWGFTPAGDTDTNDGGDR